jgi:hypothetical protein
LVPGILRIQLRRDFQLVDRFLDALRIQEDGAHGRVRPGVVGLPASHFPQLADRFVRLGIRLQRQGELEPEIRILRRRAHGLAKLRHRLAMHPRFPIRPSQRPMRPCAGIRNPALFGLLERLCCSILPPRQRRRAVLEIVAAKRPEQRRSLPVENLRVR